MPAPKPITYKGIEYRSLRSFIKNIGMNRNAELFKRLKNNQDNIDNILLAANKMKRKN